MILGSLKPEDYAVFAISLIAYMLIGLYFLVRGNRTSSDLVLGGSSLNPLPVGISLAVTSLSAILITEIPKEIFYYGIMFWIATCSEFFGGLVFALVFVPTLHKSKATTIYEFIDNRFQFAPLRVLCSVLSLLQLQLYMVLVFFAAAYILKLSIFDISQSLVYPGLILGAVTTFYTGIGGMKAVVVVDTVQYLIILAGVIAMLAVGLQTAGDPSTAFSTLRDHGRLHLFDFNFNIWQRHTFWNLFLGGFVSIMATNMNQMIFQRLRSVGSVKKAIIASLLYSLIKWVLVTIVVFAGLAIYASFASCKFSLAQNHDRTLVIDFVRQHLSSIPVMAGLLLAALVAGALSTMSSGINSMATIVWNDFLCHWPVMNNLSNTRQIWTVRILGVGFGILTTVAGINFDVKIPLLPFLIAVMGALFGATLGVIILAMYSKSARGPSVMIALLISVSLTFWWGYGNGIYIKEPWLPFNYNCSTAEPTASPYSDEQPASWIRKYLYSISYQLFYPISLGMMLFLGQILSWIEQLIFKSMNAGKSKPKESTEMVGMEKVGDGITDDDL